MHTPCIHRRAVVDPLARLVGEDRDEPPVTGIEIEMPFVFIIQIGLVKQERHAKHPLPKVDTGLAIRAHHGDVMHAKGLNFLHIKGFPMLRHKLAQMQ